MHKQTYSELLGQNTGHEIRKNHRNVYHAENIYSDSKASPKAISNFSTIGGFPSCGTSRKVLSCHVDRPIGQDNEFYKNYQRIRTVSEKTVLICSGVFQMSDVTYHFVSHVLKITLNIPVHSILL